MRVHSILLFLCICFVAFSTIVVAESVEKHPKQLLSQILTKANNNIEQSERLFYNEKTQLLAFVLSNRLWSDPIQPFRKVVEIPVCWLDSPDIYSVQKKKIQQAIADTWEANSLVRFTGWADCSGSMDFPGVVIGITENSRYKGILPRSYIGLESKDYYPGVYLSMEPGKTHKEYFSGCGKHDGISNDECAIRIAIHEFGHILGFIHEYNHSDMKNNRCKKDNDAFMGYSLASLFFLGKWDETSIMNYCNPIWNNGGKLSLIDKMSLRLFYDNIAIADFARKQIEIPVINYDGAVYSALFEQNQSGYFVLRYFSATQATSSAPAKFDGATLTIPMMAYTKDSFNWNAAESIVMKSVIIKNDAVFELVDAVVP